MKAIIEIIKENKLQTIIISCLIVVLTFSVSYAVFFKSESGTVQSGNIGNLDITYTDGETFNFSNQIPLLSEEVLEYASSYDFIVKNTGNVVAYAEISFSELVIDDVLKSDGNFKWALYEGETKLSEGNFQNASTILSLKKNISLSASATKTYTIRVWVNDNGENQNHLLNKTMTGKISVSATTAVVATTFDCTETIENFIISEPGNYKIEAAGASGTVGNTYGFIGTPPVGGKGATLSSTFALNNGDELAIVVGCKGSSTDGNNINATAGAGGGGSFIFKKIDSITDNTYQFQKGEDYYEVLLVAAGGSGTQDVAYAYSQGATPENGKNGVGDTWIIPGGDAYSTQTATPESPIELSNVLSISQFISYDLKGNRYSNSGGTCFGGFGGGGCTGNNFSYGGGWSNGSTRGAATSFSSGTDTNGTTGTRTGNGYVKIYKD